MILTDILNKNLDVIFFFYGLAFVILGITIFIQLRITRKSEFRLLNILWLLAWFGITHGTNELIDMFTIIKGANLFLEIAGPLLLFVSYLFIFFFGYQLINIGNKKIVGLWFLAAVAFSFFGLPALAGITSFHSWHISARYFLGFPGAILSAIGFLLYYQSESEKLTDVPVKKYFIFTAIFFGIYGVLGGLIVPRADFFPASAINTASFILWTGFPVQLFRAICAIGIAWSVGNIMNIFNIEETTLHKRAEEEIKRAKEFSENILDTMVDGVDIVDQNCTIQFMNKAFLDLFGKEAVGKKCYEVYRTDKKQCEFCPLHKEINIGETKTLEVSGVVGEKTFLISHTGMRNADGSFSILEVFKDITELKIAEENKVKLAKLQESDRMKNEFMSVVSHELKTPLTPLMAYIYLFLKGNIGPITEQQKETFLKMEKQSKHLLGIIDSILDVSRIETGRILDLEKKPLIIINMVKSVIEIFEDDLRSSEMQVSTDLPEDLPTLVADEAKLIRALVNVLGNAIRFSPKGSRMEIKARQSDGGVELQVKDHGIGIAGENLKRVFDKFYQVDSSYTREVGGLGLGLTVAREIIEAHGGKIWAESEGLGKGTTLKFTLPVV